ncbi:phosphatase and actin regulator 4-like [Rhopalosiphum maidis]|uniref:phosphatase and actin regulator 4-like n=1 Tax=Rhopalosiphum maidis TaxID=43146 RepID=UPI000F0043D1|nr:phosphatase and actin regulator 4-like [Rhopalosiphum maidis]
MALTIVLGLTILSVVNYGNTFEFSGLNPSVQIKSQIKPTIKPFSTQTNQPYQADQFKSTFGQNTVPAKPFGAPFDHFKPAYQPYQPFRTNYQPFGPYPGYPGPVVYPGHGGYQGPEAYSSPSYRFDEPNHKPFGFQPLPAPVQPTFNQYKFGPAKKFNKNFPGLADFNQPGKYFQEHQFGAYHGPEFSSAIVPAEHNIKQSKPKDTFLGKPIFPTLPEFGLPKQTSFGFPSPSFGYPVPNFPPVQPFVSTVIPSVKSAPTTVVPVDAVNVEKKFGGAEITTSVVPSSSAQDESATVQQKSEEVTGKPSAATPESPAQEEITTGLVSTAEEPAAEVAPNNEKPAAEVAPNNEVPAAEVATNNEVPAAEVATNNEVPAAAQDAAPADEQSTPPSESNEPISSADNEKIATVPENQEPVVELGSVVVAQEVKETSSAAPAEVSNNPSESSTVGGSESTSAKSELVTENKPDAGVPTVSLPGLPVELQNSNFGSISDTSSLGLFGASGFPPNFGQSVSVQQPSYYPYFDAPKFSEEELKAFAASFGTNVPQSGQVIGSADPTVKITESTFSNPSAEIATKLETGDKVVSEDKAVSGEKKTTVESQSRNIPESQPKLNTVQIIQDDPFNGQLPLLYDPSNSGSPLDTYKFYNHPSVAALSSQASLASYSPESAFNNFGTQFRQGYLVEGSPSLTPLTKTVVQSGQTPISISSLDHPLHSQVFKYSQSFVPYPGLVTGNNNGAAFQTFDVSSTAAPVVSSTTAAAAAADVSVQSTSAPDVAVESSSEVPAAETA